MAQPVIRPMFAPGHGIVNPDFQESKLDSSSDLAPTTSVTAMDVQRQREDRPFTHAGIDYTVPTQQTPLDVSQPDGQVSLLPGDNQNKLNTLSPLVPDNQVVFEPPLVQETHVDRRQIEEGSTVQDGSDMAESPRRSGEETKAAIVQDRFNGIMTPMKSRRETSTDLEMNVPEHDAQSYPKIETLVSIHSNRRTVLEEQEDRKTVSSEGAVKASQAPLQLSLTDTPVLPIRVAVARDTLADPDTRADTGAYPSSQPHATSIAEKPSSTSTIRVTIGRIEVRAVMPLKETVVPALPTRPATALSLDDYLKQSKGGQ